MLLMSFPPKSFKSKRDFFLVIIIILSFCLTKEALPTRTDSHLDTNRQGHLDFLSVKVGLAYTNRLSHLEFLSVEGGLAFTNTLSHLEYMNRLILWTGLNKIRIVGKFSKTRTAHHVKYYFFTTFSRDYSCAHFKRIWNLLNKIWLIKKLS
jgi:hypothetical protein